MYFTGCPVTVQFTVRCTCDTYSNANCTDIINGSSTISGRTCQCPYGFVGDGERNGTGCVCGPGFELSGGQCLDIDACKCIQINS